MADQCLRLLNDIRFLVPHVPECTSLLSATIEFATHLAIETTSVLRLLDSCEGDEA